MQSYLWIAIGGALGSVDRYWRSGVTARLIGETFSWGTLIVNVIGSLVIGFFATITGPDGRLLVGPIPRHFVMIGICDGYTTSLRSASRRSTCSTTGSGSTPAPTL